MALHKTTLRRALNDTPKKAPKRLRQICLTGAHNISRRKYKHSILDCGQCTPWNAYDGAIRQNDPDGSAITSI